MKEDRQPVIYGGGTQSRDFIYLPEFCKTERRQVYQPKFFTDERRLTYVTNVVEGNILAATDNRPPIPGMQSSVGSRQIESFNFSIL